jgi:hypothetical protein
MKLKTAILAAALFAELVALSRGANAATAYYVSASSVYVRSQPGEYVMGRLYYGQRMDIQHIDSNGWAYGYAYGHVNRCVWAQFRENGNTNFWTHGTTVADRCRNSNKYLSQPEFTNGEIWGRGTSDGVFYTLPRATNMWDNWVWGGRWGNHSYRGVSPAGSLWKIRYTTNDGAGVMARPCSRNANGGVTCYHDWMFIQRSSIN